VSFRGGLKDDVSEIGVRGDLGRDQLSLFGKLADKVKEAKRFERAVPYLQAM